MNVALKRNVSMLINAEVIKSRFDLTNPWEHCFPKISMPHFEQAPSHQDNLLQNETQLG